MNSIKVDKYLRLNSINIQSTFPHLPQILKAIKVKTFVQLDIALQPKSEIIVGKYLAQNIIKSKMK